MTRSDASGPNIYYIHFVINVIFHVRFWCRNDWKHGCALFFNCSVHHGGGVSGRRHRIDAIVQARTEADAAESLLLLTKGMRQIALRPSAQLADLTTRLGETTVRLITTFLSVGHFFRTVERAPVCYGQQCRSAINM